MLLVLTKNQPQPSPCSAYSGLSGTVEDAGDRLHAGNRTMPGLTEQQLPQLLRSPLRILPAQLDQLQHCLATGATDAMGSPASVLQPGDALLLVATNPLVAVVAADAEVTTQLRNVGAWRLCRQYELSSQIHGTVFLPRHRPALHLSPTSCPLTCHRCRVPPPDGPRLRPRPLLRSQTRRPEDQKTRRRPLKTWQA